MSEQNTAKMTELALSLVRSGNLPEAKALYKQLCLIDKNNAEAWIMLGAINAELGNLAEALSSQQQAIALQPRSVKAHMHLAKVYLRTSKLYDARSSCQTALELQPDLAAAWVLLAKVHMQSGRNEEAESCCCKAIAITPDLAEVYFTLGKALHAQEKLDKCIENYREALKRNPRHAKAYYRLGMALYGQGKFDEAAESYNNALRINPNQPAVHFNLGVALQEQKKLGAAETCYRETLRLKPDYAKARGSLEYVLHLQGRIEDVVTNHQAALKKIIGFALWGADPKYLVGAVRNAELAKTIYPGWVARFYIGTSVPRSIVEQLRKNDAEIIEMGVPGDWTGTFWRFLPAGDPDVEVMISRDVDSRLSLRERTAVDAWLRSTKAFHIMRDHPCHTLEIPAGMWGARGGILRNINDMVKAYHKDDYWQVDQNFLREKVWPLVAHQAFVHDEFFQRTPHPFPTARIDYEFVGDVFDENEKRHEEYLLILKKHLTGIK